MLTVLSVHCDSMTLVMRHIALAISLIAFAIPFLHHQRQCTVTDGVDIPAQRARRRAELRSELDLLVQLQPYRNVVTVVALVPNVDGLTFLLEHCAQGSVRDVLQQTPAPSLPVRARLAKASARALHFLHTRPLPIIHGDLKSANILVAADGTVRVADFGLSRTQTQTSGLALSSLTYAGTPNFMSPEQFQQEISKLTFKVRSRARRPS